MEKYYDHRTGKEYTRTESSLNYSEGSTIRESEKLELPTWVKVIDFYLSQFDKKKQEAAK
jgi:hypothetical protein